MNYLDASIRGIKWSLLRKHIDFRPQRVVELNQIFSSAEAEREGGLNQYPAKKAGLVRLTKKLKLIF